MPFWHGDTAGRPAEFGRQIGEMTRELLQLPRPVAYTKLVEDHSLDANAAENLLSYLEDQVAATGVVPSDRGHRDRTLSRRTGRLADLRAHAFRQPRPRAVVHGGDCHGCGPSAALEVETMWSDDGFVIRLPDTPKRFHRDDAAAVGRGIERSGAAAAGQHFAVRRQVSRGRRPRAIAAPAASGRCALRSGNNASALPTCLPWPRDSLRFRSLLETYRECVRELLDLGSAADVLEMIERGSIRVTTVDSAKPSPSLRRCCSPISRTTSMKAMHRWPSGARKPSPSISRSLKKSWAVPTSANCWIAAALDEVEAQLQASSRIIRRAMPTALHDLLLKLGDLTEAEIAARSRFPGGGRQH